MGKILVTGGAGFIGSHLVDRLVRDGETVLVLDNFDKQVHCGKKPDYLNKKARYIEGDIRDEKALKEAFKGVDRVFHFAAKVGVGQSMYEIKEYVSCNTYGTSFLWDYIINKRMPIKKFVVASSMSIYGEGGYVCPRCGPASPHLRKEVKLKKKIWEHPCPACGNALSPRPTTEEKDLLSTSIYAITKKNQEEISLCVGISYKIPTVALRFFNVYGPRQSLSNPYTGVCAIFSSRIKNDNCPIIYEDGMQTRDFINVADIVEGCITAMNDNRCDYNYFNVGTGKAVSVKEIAETLIKLYGKKSVPEIVGRYRVGDVRHCFADIDKLKKIGFAPRIKLEDGLKELVEWGKQASAKDMVTMADRELEKRSLKI